MFRSIETNKLEPRIEVIDNELMKFYEIPEDNNISLPLLAVVHHKTWFSIFPKKHIAKTPVATAELRSMLLRALFDVRRGTCHSAPRLDCP
jgi:hypothetical protein